MYRKSIALISSIFVMSLNISLANSASLDDLKSEIEKIHNSCSSNLSIGFDCIVTDTFQHDPVSFEKYTGLKKKAIEGNMVDQITPDEVDEWYDFISQPYRNYDMSLKFLIKNDNIRRVKNAPQKTKKLIEMWEGDIINTAHNSIFRLHHREKLIDILPRSEETAGWEISLFNPVDLFYPLSTNLDVNAVQMKETEEGIEIDWVNGKKLDPHYGNEFISIHAILDPKNHYVSKKTLIKRYRTPVIYQYFYSEQNSFTEIDGVVVPQDVKLLQFVQFDSRVKNQECEGVPILKSDAEITLNSIDVNSFCDFDKRYFLELDKGSVSTETIDDSVFWPTVPEGYKFQDFRFLNIDKDLDRDEQKKIEEVAVGYGPYEFPFVNE